MEYQFFYLKIMQKNSLHSSGRDNKNDIFSFSKEKIWLYIRFETSYGDVVDDELACESADNGSTQLDGKSGKRMHMRTLCASKGDQQ